MKKRSPERTTMTGILRLHPRGFGFVIADNSVLYPEDVFIPRHLTANAVDGDHVEVELAFQQNSEKGPEGKISSILSRTRSHLAGTVCALDHRGYLSLIVPLLGISKSVMAPPDKEHKFVVGDRVVLKIDEDNEREGPLMGTIVRKIGNINDASTDVPCASEEFDLPSTFPAAVIKQAKSHGSRVTSSECKGREDLTDTICFTIDPETAKDFDDALSIAKDSSGNFDLIVHIADVAHYIPADSPLDQEAYVRSNSTYFPGSCLPMLPEELSNNLCSLKEKVLRLTVSVFMRFDCDGNLKSSRIERTVIRSQKRFTYPEAYKIIQGQAKSPFRQQLLEMVELCCLLKKKRSERGAVDFALPELVIVVDKSGEPTGTRVVEYDLSHQLVEEFMLKANEVVATHLSKKGKNLIHRVHEEPSKENLKEFYALARQLGFHVPAEPTQRDLQMLFEEAKKTAFGQQLFISFIRSMRLATYSSENVGHWGLSLEHYCHFTSPIRRYTDLITERLLFDEEGVIDLDKISLKCSEQERISFKAESHVKSLKKLRLLKKYFQENSTRTFKGAVTKVKPFGLFFEIQELALEGFLHISQLESDYFLYSEERQILKGERSGHIHALGEAIEVRPLRIDLIRQESEWALITKNPRKTLARKR